ncbi:MAG: MmcQ/YjbR family DNA-binding protein [Ignavibacteriales bacterium]|nr:MmcQ/YjbR family DNA-binding protein [Ignavibacteriales bacterium]MCF8306109.1 MmcQ/YjbR family DNA-binding protein [Ignavibacteriales bacterium]MCF8437296.1 MmcQ/YjbR family DNA-binding protein [Ignavibacteriales bacterium]
MTLEELRQYCITKKGVTESFPFDKETLVFKVLDKMFLLTNITLPLSINIKCDPEKIFELIEDYKEVGPGYHMNKKHWITVDLEGKLKDNLVKSWVDNSYDLVVRGLPKIRQKELWI